MRALPVWMVCLVVFGQAALVVGTEDATLERWDAEAWLTAATNRPKDVSLAPEWMSDSADLGESMETGCQDNPAWAADCPHLADQCANSAAMKIKCRKTCGCGPEVHDPIPHAGGNGNETKVDPNAKPEEPEIDMKQAVAGEAVMEIAEAAKKKLEKSEQKLSADTKQRREDTAKETKAAEAKNNAKTEKKNNDLKKLIATASQQTKVKVVKPKKKEDVVKKAAANQTKAEPKKGVDSTLELDFDESFLQLDEHVAVHTHAAAGNATKKDDPACVDHPAWKDDCEHLAMHCASSMAMKIKCRKTCGCGEYIRDPITSKKADSTEKATPLEPKEAKEVAKTAAEATKAAEANGAIPNIKPVIPGETQIQQAKKAAETLSAEEAKKKADQDKRRAATQTEEKTKAKADEAKIDKETNEMKKMEQEAAAQTQVKVVKPQKKGDTTKKADADSKAEADKASKEKVKKVEKDMQDAETKAEKVATADAKKDADKVQNEIKATEAKATSKAKKEEKALEKQQKSDEDMRAEAESDLAESNEELKQADEDGDDVELLEAGESVPKTEKEQQQWAEARKAAQVLVAKVVHAGKVNGAQEAQAAAQLEKDARPKPR